MVSPIVIDPATIQNLIEKAVEQHIVTAIETMTADPQWRSRIEAMINQSIVEQTSMNLNQLDVNALIRGRVDENMANATEVLAKNFESTGISDQATKTVLTVMDDTTVVENRLISSEIEVDGSAVINNLVVRGAINVDNYSWNTLAENITQKTVGSLTDQWKAQLIAEVTDKISTDGINFDNVKVNNDPLIVDGQLSRKILSSNLQSVGLLKELRVGGEARINDTLVVVNSRIGINTEEPEMAISVWDQEVAVNIGKFKENQAYIGTSRAQGLSLGVNRLPQIEIDADGLTTIKQLRVGQFRISHHNMVPGWSGTKGDLVLNNNPGSDRVFAWQCVGGFRWQPLKSAE